MKDTPRIFTRTLCRTALLLFPLAGAARADAVFNYTGGLQTFNVPQDGYYSLTATGGTGGGATNSSGGAGATQTGQIYLTAGTTLQVAVGGAGGTGSSAGAGGGGGGSFVYLDISTPVTIAGAGGGGAPNGGNGSNAPNSSSGGNGTGAVNSGSGGTDGSGGGTIGIGGGGGGGGFVSAGSNGSGNGGAPAPSFAGGSGEAGGGGGGAYGGGGGGAATGSAGGGGGYSGGGAGGATGQGGGGGSFIVDTLNGHQTLNPSLTTGTNPSGNGSVSLCAVAYVVTNTNDSGAGSLRDAIARLCAGNTIIFSSSSANGATNFYDGSQHTITLTSQLTMSSNFTIRGPGAKLLTISGNGATRVFKIKSGVTVTLESLTIGNGTGNRDINVGFIGGGGIWNQGTLTLTNSTVSGNSASGTDSNWGGGIYNQGTLTLIRSTVTGNSASGGTSNIGGGIYNSFDLATAATVSLINSTVSNNSVTGPNNGGGSTAGGIYNQPFDGYDARITLINSTISNNSASGSSGNVGGGIVNEAQDNNGVTLSSRNSIIAGNSASTGSPDVAGPLTSQGHNIIANTSNIRGFTITPKTGDKFDSAASPLNLSSLQDNGGPTLTVSPRLGSTAIDAGDDCVTSNTCSPQLTAALTTDQRGYARKSGAHVDIGAVEVQSSFVVINTKDGGAGSLRDALVSVGDGGTVTFNIPTSDPGYSSGVYTITLAGQLVIDKPVTISGPGASQLTVSGNNASRVFNVTAASGSALSISGLTIANGKVAGDQVPGGGINNAIGAALNITGCSFLDNQTATGARFGNTQDIGYGGAIYNASGGSLNVRDSVFERNYSSVGGGICNASGGSISIIGSRFDANAALGGGGIATSAGSGSVDGCVFTGNTGNFYSGGIDTSDQVLDVRNSTFSDNVAGSGAGITNVGGTLNVSGCTFSGNHDAGQWDRTGGGICNGSSSTVGTSSPSIANVVNSTFTGNSVGQDGAAIYNTQTGNTQDPATGPPQSGIVTVTACTIVGNSVSQASNAGGGGICNITSTDAGVTNTVHIANTIIALNSDEYGIGPDVSGAFMSSGHNFIGASDHSTGFTNGTNNDQVGTSASPLDPKLSPLADNGGPTQTMALLSGSTAIDAGADCLLNNSCTPTLAAPLATDQRGLLRKSGAHVDIGAFELGPLDAWRQLHFGSMANTGPGADNSDPDGDGVPNLVEFFTGTDPTIANGPPTHMTLDNQNNAIDLTFDQSHDAIAAGLQFQVEWTDDLNSGGWSTTGVTYSEIDDTTVNHMTAMVPQGTAGHRFVRLRVSY